jgi:cytochrome c biogenesis protein
MNTLLKEGWKLLCSVKLALFCFIALAVTSIIGTIIPQGERLSFYSQKYGSMTAKIFILLDVPDMYHSFWFIGLLILFVINLTACSINRLPRVWRQFKQDNLAVKRDRIEKMRHRHAVAFDGNTDKAAIETAAQLKQLGWQTRRAQSEDGAIVLFSQKNAWTRFGVYIVHASILVVFIGAIIGAVLGVKGSVMLPEGSMTDRFFLFDGKGTAHRMDFQVRCDRFGIDYYPDGMPKEYWSELVVLQDGKEMLSKKIEVNKPLKYGGFTFYQSSYQDMAGQYFLTLENPSSANRQSFIVRPGKEHTWPQENIHFGIVNSGPDGRGLGPYRIWFSDKKDRPAQFWAENGKEITISRSGIDFSFMVKQRFSTGLQVAKDPGVWWVYGGFTIMLLGLFVVFFLSHQRIWVVIQAERNKTSISLTGTSNKNSVGFEKTFNRIGATLEELNSNQQEK